MEPSQQSEISSVLRPLSLAELLDRTFSLYRKHFLLFFGIAVIAPLLKLAGQSLADASSFWGGSSSSWSPILGVVVVILVVAGFLLYITAFVMSQAATMFAVTSTYLQQPIAIREAYRKSWPYLRSLFWLIVQTSLRVGLGFILFVIPGILLTLNYSVSIPVAIFERLRGSEALNRSTELTSGYRGRIFLLYFVFWLIAFILGLPAGYLEKSPSGTFLGSPFLPQFIDFLTSSLVDPILLIALALVYYDLRVRKEAFDLEFMMASLDAAKDQAQATMA